MFLAYGILFFALGFVVALLKARKPKGGESGIDGTLAWVDHATKLIRSGDVTQTFRDTFLADEKGEWQNEPHQPTHLLTKADVETRFEASSWQRLAYDEFKATIMGKSAERKTFPCIYATMGYRSDDHRYVFLESDNPSEPRNLRLIAPAMREYLRISTTLGPNTSLVIVGAPSESATKTVQDYNNHFWDMLRGLRISDKRSWPSEIPQDTNSEKWMFCFEGEPLFPVMLTPAHQRRWSRHMSVPVIAMQPKWVLDKLLSTPEKRESATNKVRKLLADYDLTEISPDLTSYGQPGTSEIRQLCLMDENETAVCPYDNFDA